MPEGDRTGLLALYMVSGILLVSGGSFVAVDAAVHGDSVAFIGVGVVAWFAGAATAISASSAYVDKLERRE